jgi:hypothetical protein
LRRAIQDVAVTWPGIRGGTPRRAARGARFRHVVQEAIVPTVKPGGITHNSTTNSTGLYGLGLHQIPRCRLAFFDRHAPRLRLLYGSITDASHALVRASERSRPERRAVPELLACRRSRSFWHTPAAPGQQRLAGAPSWLGNHDLGEAEYGGGGA